MNNAISKIFVLWQMLPNGGKVFAPKINHRGGFIAAIAILVPIVFMACSAFDYVDPILISTMIMVMCALFGLHSLGSAAIAAYICGFTPSFIMLVNRTEKANPPLPDFLYVLAAATITIGIATFAITAYRWLKEKYGAYLPAYLLAITGACVWFTGSCVFPTKGMVMYSLENHQRVRSAFVPFLISDRTQLIVTAEKKTVQVTVTARVEDKITINGWTLSKQGNQEPLPQLLQTTIQVPLVPHRLESYRKIASGTFDALDVRINLDHLSDASAIPRIIAEVAKKTGLESEEIPLDRPELL